jgi:ribosomal protein L2
MSIEPTIDTSDELIDFVGRAQPGDVCVYHRGHLAYDASLEGAQHDGDHRSCLTKLSGIAYALYRNGRVLLVQRRDGEEFAYLAVRSSRSVALAGAPMIHQVREAA